MRALALLCAVLTASAVTNGQSSYYSVDGMQGLKITCDSEAKLEYVRAYENLPGFDFNKVTRDRSVPVEVFVAPEQLPVFKDDLSNNDIDYEVFVEDVGRVIEENLALVNLARLNRAENNILKTFPRYAEIKSYLTLLATTRSKIVSMFSIGKSFEGRDIVGVKISSGGKDKPALFMDAGIHAREWIAPTTALYAIQQLAENATNSYIFDNIDIYIVPSLNPDGYEYTHTSKYTRMWRKTRSINPNSQCLGADPNRNFGYKWMTIGASADPCTDIYAGQKAFSEPETAALRDFILARKNLIKVYLTFHSYGNYILHPWGFTADLPENEPVLRRVAKKAEAKLSSVRGTRYEIGSSTRVLYAAAGGSDDWAMAVGGADLAYTVELPDGRYGFAAPPSEIEPVGRETFEAIKVFAEYVANSV